MIEDEFDRPFEPWEVEDMKRLRQGLVERPLGGQMTAIERPYGATYTAGIGWQAVTPTGRYGNYETENAAVRAARARYYANPRRKS